MTDPIRLAQVFSERPLGEDLVILSFGSPEGILMLSFGRICCSFLEFTIASIQ